jgi:hypothetical protein
MNDDRFLSVTRELDKVQTGMGQISAICLQKICVESDEKWKTIRDSSSSVPWKTMEIDSCHISRLPYLMENMLCRKNVKALTLRKFDDAALENCMKLLNSFCMITRLKKLTIEARLSEQSCLSLWDGLSTKSSSISSSLVHLRLECCTFPNQGALTIFAKGLKETTSISTLVLADCGLRDDDFKILLPNIAPSIDFLDLSGNYCRTHIKSINPTLKSLNLTNQHPGEFGGSLDLSDFNVSMTSNLCLQELDLSFNMLTIHEIYGLVRSLKTNVTLQSLNLMNNQLDDKAIQYIGEQLPHMKGLRRLDITANRFGDQGADALYNGLKKNVCLTHLLMPLGFAAQDDIMYLLALNKCGRRLLLYNSQHGAEDSRSCRPSLPLGVWPLILARVNMLSKHEMSQSMKASALFFLLQGPVLLKNIEF